MALKFPRDVTQTGNIIGISRGGALFCPEFPRVGKVKTQKIPGVFSNMYIFKSSKAALIINGGFIFHFHDGIHSKIPPTILEMFFRQFIKMNTTE